MKTVLLLLALAGLCSCADTTEVTGRLVDARGAPVPGQAVEIVDQRPHPTFGETMPPTVAVAWSEPDGRFRVILRGEYKNRDAVEVFPAGEFEAWVEIRGGWNENWRYKDVEVAPGTANSTISGRLIDGKTGRPVVGKEMDVDDNGFRTSTTRTDSEGRFQLTIPGLYEARHISEKGVKDWDAFGLRVDEKKTAGWRIEDVEVKSATK